MVEIEQRWEEVCKALNKVESTRSRTQKGFALQLCKAEDELKRLLKYALDFHNLYGITLEEHGKSTPYEPHFVEFVQILETVLEHRTSPTALRDFYEKYPCKWFARVVNHDLRCGLGIKTINHEFPELIPEFSVQLAEPYDDKIRVLRGPWILEPKFDGIRGLIARFDGKTPQCLSRNGKELFNTQLVLKWLENMYGAMPALAHHVLDGEFVVTDWNQTVSTLHTQTSIPNANNVKFQLFDVVPVENFPYDARPVEDRKLILEQLAEYVTEETPVQVVKGLEVQSIDDAWHVAKTLHDRGFEGAIIKRMGSAYEGKRSANWTKLKFYNSCDVTIDGVEEGSGRLQGTLGALVCHYGRYVTKVGSGFNDEMRKELWDKKELLLGKKAEITYQELTEDSFRFPIFMRLREDKS